MRHRLLFLALFIGGISAIGAAAHAETTQERVARQHEAVRAKIACTRALMHGGTCAANLTTTQTAESTPDLPASSRVLHTKRIDISIAEQRLRAYEGDRVVIDTPISTGTSNTPTPRGSFEIGSKDELLWSTYGAYLPYAMHVTGESYIHGLPVTKDGRTVGADLIGRPASRGCIRVPTATAQRLFEWAPQDTLVVIR